MRFIKFLVLAIFINALVAVDHDAFAACAIPEVLNNGQTADATAIMENFDAVAGCIETITSSGDEGAVQYKSPAAGLGGVSLPAGQLMIGSSGAPPEPKPLSAGPGIAISSGPGAITITATSNGSPYGVDWLNEDAVVRPISSNFSLSTSTTMPTGAAIITSQRGMVLTTSAGPNATALMAEVATPNGPWQATMLAVYSGSLSTLNLPGISVRDSINNRAVNFGIGSVDSSNYGFTYSQTIGGTGLDTNVGGSTTSDIGLPPPSQPIWSRFTFDGTNLSWSFSRDGEVFSTAFTALAHQSLTNLDRVGPGVLFQQPAQPAWPSAYHILSWQASSL